MNYGKFGGQYVSQELKDDKSDRLVGADDVKKKFKNNYYYYLTINPWVPIQLRYAIVNNIEKMNSWRDCLSNGKLKLLKAPNGQKWVVKINQ